MHVKMSREPQISDADHQSCITNRIECPMLEMRQEPQISDSDHPSSNRVAAGGVQYTSNCSGKNDCFEASNIVASLTKYGQDKYCCKCEQKQCTE